MRFAQIHPFDIADGPGIRVALFVSGCRNGCPGCFNADAQDFSYGREFDATAREELMRLLSREQVRGLTILGGEPMEPENQPGVLDVMLRVREELPGKDIWLYSGFTYEQMSEGPSRAKTGLSEAILDATDVLVDGPFVAAEADRQLLFRGSRNQRLVDVPATRKAGRVTTWRGEGR